MKRYKKKLKKGLALLIAMLLCFNSFAAVVSDNDGSAFITKAEFDSLKNNFQAQIDNYNTSIDAKIDGAIASYLAGIQISKNENRKLSLIDSKLEYPLEINMKNTEFDVTAYDDWVYNSCWKPDYDWTFSFQRAAKYGSCRIKYSNYDANNKLKWFYKGSRSGDNYKVTGIVKNYKITLKGSFNLMNTSKTTMANLSAAVFMDQTGKVSAEISHGTSYNRTNIITDYTKYNFLIKTNIGSNKPPVEFVDCWSQTSGPNLGTYNNKLYTAVSGTNVWQGLTNASGDYITGEASFNEENITRVFNFADATTTEKTGSVVAPVTYNYDLYVTNKDKQKQDCTEVGTVTLYEDNATVSGGTFYIRHVVDPGWCLEPENYGQTSRNWYNKSLINPKRLVYDFTTPYSETKYENHKMIEGIPLTEIEKKNDKIQYNYLEVEFTITKNSGHTATPYIFFFTKPTDVYQTSEITGDDFLDISTSEKLTSKSKYKSLDAGKNKIYVDVSKLGSKNQPIYYKVIWSSTMNKSLSISKPTVTLRLANSIT